MFDFLFVNFWNNSANILSLYIVLSCNKDIKSFFVISLLFLLNKIFLIFKTLFDRSSLRASSNSELVISDEEILH